MMDTASAPPMLGGARSLLARLVLPGLVLVVVLVLSRFLLLAVFVLAGLLARLLVGLFWAVSVCTGLLTRFVLATVFVAGGAFLLPVAGV